MSLTKNTNPAGNPSITIGKPVVKQGKIGPPSEAVRRKQAPDHSRADFLRDVDKVTQKRGDRQ